MVGTYSVFAAYGFFNVWYKKDGNANMLFFQIFVLKLAFVVGLVNVVWNLQNWVAEEENKEMIKKEVIDKMIDEVIKRTESK